jgi:hypothetical protein
LTNEEMEIQELSVEEFSKLSDSGGKIDYEELWNKVTGKILTTAGLTAKFNEVRKEKGLSVRDMHWSEKDRIFKNWKAKERTIDTKVGYTGKHKTNVYRFSEAVTE